MVGWGFWFVMFTCMEIVPAKYNRWKTGANSQTIRKHQDSPDSVWCNAQGPRDHRKLGACQMRRNKQRGKQADSTSGKWHAKGGHNTKDENLGRSKSTSAEQNKQLSNTQAVRRLKQEKLPEATLGGWKTKRERGRGREWRFPNLLCCLHGPAVGKREVHPAIAGGRVDMPNCSRPLSNCSGMFWVCYFARLGFWILRLLATGL